MIFNKFEVERIKVYVPSSRRLDITYTSESIRMMFGLPGIYYLGIHAPTQWSVYELYGEETEKWLKQQPADMWFTYINDMHEYPNIGTYVISPELEIWLKLKFK